MQRTQPKILGYSTVSFLCGDCIEKPFLVIIAVGFRDICCNHLLALEHHKLVLLSACNTVLAQSPRSLFPSPLLSTSTNSNF